MAARRHVPVFQEDRGFRDRDGSRFNNVQRLLRDDLDRAGFGPSWSNWDWGSDLDQICGNLMDMKPRRVATTTTGGTGGHQPHQRDSQTRDGFGSRDGLDEVRSGNGVFEDPETKGRVFRTSFDVKTYDPSDISVKVEGDAMLVVARHEDVVGSNKSVREFSRRVQLPKDVDPDKLSSTMSDDGILTIEAPLPPKYHSVAYPGHTARSGSPAGARAGAGSPRGYPRQDPPPHYHPTGATSPAPVPPHQAATASSAARMHSQPRDSPSRASPAHTPAPAPAPAPAPTPSPPPPSAAAMPQTPEIPLDTPTFVQTASGHRMMDLVLEVGKPYTPDDLVVKLEDKTLTVEAEHVEKGTGKSGKCSMSRSFDIAEELDPSTIEALLRTDGRLCIQALVKDASAGD